MKKHARGFRAGFLVMIWAACGVLIAGTKELHKTFAALDRVKIATVSGDCIVKAGASDKIVVDLVYTVEPEKAFEPSILESGKTLRIKELWHGTSSGEVLWTLTVPPNTEIEFSTASGNLTVENLTKSIEGSTASGDFTITGFRGEIDISTASGDVNLEDVEGRIEVSTASGSVDATNVRGEIDMSTASGDVEVNDSKGTFDLSCASGSVEASGIRFDEESSFSTASGHVVVKLAETPQVDLELSNASGRVVLDGQGHPIQGTIECSAKKNRGRISVPFAFDREEEYQENGDVYVRKTIVKGSPAPRILLETSTGSVTIKP